MQVCHPTQAYLAAGLTISKAPYIKHLPQTTISAELVAAAEATAAMEKILQHWQKHSRVKWS